MHAKKTLRTKALVLAALALTASGSFAAAEDATTKLPDGSLLPAGFSTKKMAAGVVIITTTGAVVYEPKPQHFTCDTRCQRDWQPLAASWLTLDDGRWSTVAAADGTRQWAYEGRPLYVAQSAQLEGPTRDWAPIVVSKLEYPSTVRVTKVRGQDSFTDAHGKTLYVSVAIAQLGRMRSSVYSPEEYRARKRQPQNNGVLPPCEGECAATWPPFAAHASDKPRGDWTVVTRSDGTLQWAYKGKPVHTFNNDKEPGDSLGQSGFDFVRRSFWQVALVD